MTLLWTALALLIAIGLKAQVAPEGATVTEPDTAGADTAEGADPGADAADADAAGDDVADDVEASDEPGDGQGTDEADSEAEGDDGEDHVTDESDDDAEPEGKNKEGDAADASTIDKELAIEAKAMGFTDEEIAQFDSDDDLQRALNFHARKYLDGKRASPKADDTKPQGDKPQDKAQTDKSGQPDKPQAQGKKPSPLESRTFEKSALNLNPDLVDPEIVEGLTKFHDDLDAKIENLAAAIVTLYQKDQIREDFSEFDEFDQFIDGLGDEWADVLGKGPRFGLSPDSDVTKNRVKVLTHARQLRDLYGGKLPRKQLFKRALAAEFMDKTKQLARKDVSNKLNSRSKQRTQRPTSRQPSALPPGREAAVQFVEDYVSKKS